MDQDGGDKQADGTFEGIFLGLHASPEPGDIGGESAKNQPKQKTEARIQGCQGAYPPEDEIPSS